MAAVDSRGQKQGEIEANKRIDDALKNQAAELDLRGLGLTALPEAIGRLAQLRNLDVSRNRLTALPEAIGRLTRLRVLYASSNRLTALPEAIGRLAGLEELFLHDNEHLGLPTEVLGPDWLAVTVNKAQPAKPADILEYYFRTRAGRRPLNEAKLILVGFGGVGKTSLVNRLVDDRFDRHEHRPTN